MLANNMLTTVQAVSLIPNLKKPDDEQKNEQAWQEVSGEKTKSFEEILNEKFEETKNSNIDVSTSGYDKNAMAFKNVIYMRDYTFQKL